MQYGRMLLANSLQMSGLPDKAQAAITATFKDKPIILEDVQAAIQAWKESLADQTAAAEIQGPGPHPFHVQRR